MTHPLTSRICQEIIRDKGGSNYSHHFLEDQMRAAFDKGADWRLEQVIRYLENDLEFVLWSDSFMDKFKKAMRPQEDNS